MKILGVGKRKETLLIIAAICSLVAIMTCIICDFFISKQLDWSVIVLLSVVVAWLLVPVTIGKKASVRNSLFVASCLCVPYLAALSIILKENAVIMLGGAIAVFVWLIIWLFYFISLQLKGHQPLVILGMVFLLSIPLMVGIIWLYDSYFQQVSSPSEYNLSLWLSLLFAAGCFLFHMLKKFSYK